ncbi:MAG: hypothetical protein H6712_25610 [Myxococcales bacterium]|nr:hypothetical protein [Myxococcales bacterium]MCB9717252.1 hypothetical protein [Myxococcales bacterium]
MGDDHDERRGGSPRARARSHLQQMLRAASLGVAVTGCGDDGSTSSDGTSATTTASSGSTTWDDPCAEDGCDPGPPPMTSTGPAMTDSGTETEDGSGTADSGTSDGGTTGGGTTDTDSGGSTSSGG